MKRTWQTMSFNDYSSGMDTRSSPDNIPVTFAEDLVNIDVKSTGALEKRKGYEGFAGYVPFRATGTQVELIDGTYYHHFFLDGSLDFSGLKTTPLVVYGHTLDAHASDGDFSTTDSSSYYSTCYYGYNLRNAVSGSFTLNTLTYDDTGLETPYIAVRCGEATGTTIDDLSYTRAYLEDIRIDSPVYSFEVDARVQTAGDVFVFWKDLSEAYIETFNIESDDLVDGVFTKEITSLKHAQENLYLNVELYNVGEIGAETSAEDWERIYPDELTIDSSGNITIKIQPSSEEFQCTAIVYSSAETDKILNSTVPANDYLDIEVPVTSPWVLASVYQYNESTGKKEFILPEIEAYDDSTGMYTVRVQNITTTDIVVDMYFSYGTTSVNVISVKANNQTSSEYSKEDAILTIWGLEHSYYNSSSSGGQVTFLENYQTIGTTELLVGLGGCLFYSANRTDITTNGTSYKIPVTKTRLTSRVSSNTTIGPLFSSSPRTRHTLQCDEMESGYVPVESAEYVSGLVKYTTSELTNLEAYDSSGTGVGSPLTYSHLMEALGYHYAGDEDWLTVNNMGSSELNGTFKIVKFSTDGTSISFYVKNSSVTDDIFDEVNADGRCGVFTDKIETTSFDFTAGDVINSTDTNYTVKNTISNAWTLSTGINIVAGVTSPVNLVSGLLLSATRTSSTFPASSIASVSDGATGVEWMVKGDAVVIGNDPNKYTIKSINTYDHSTGAERICSIGVDANGIFVENLNAIANLASEDTIHINACSDPNFAGEYVLGQSSLFLNSRYVTSSKSMAYGLCTLSTADDTVTLQDHGLSTGDSVFFTTDGSSGAVNVADYVSSLSSVMYYIRVVDKDTFQLFSQKDFAIDPTYHPIIISDPSTDDYYVHQLFLASITSDSFTLKETITIEDVGGGTIVDVVNRWIPVETPSTDDMRPYYFDTNSYDSQPHLSGTMMFDNMYITNGDDEVFKYDGTNLYRAGLFRWQSGLSISPDYSNTTIPHSSVEVDVASDPSGNGYFEVASGDEEGFSVGDKIWYEGTSISGEYIVDKIEDTKVYVINAIDTDSGWTSGTIIKMDTRKYYMRLSGYDANNNRIASAITGDQDFVIDTYADHSNVISVLGLPNIGEYDYDRIELSLYRTKNGGSTFYKVATRKISDVSERRILITDTTTDESLRQQDEVNVVSEGINLGTGWEQPIKAKYCATINSQLVLANLKDYPQLDMVLRETNDGTFSASSINGDVITIRKDNTDTSTTTDIEEVINFKFVDGTSSVTISGINVAASTGIVTFTATGHGLSTGDHYVWMYNDTYKASISNVFSGLFKVTVTDANTFTIGFTDHGLSSGACTVADYCNKLVIATDTLDIPVFIGTDYCCSQNLYNDGDIINLIPSRLCQAINTLMATLDYTEIEPWITANSDSGYGLGQIVIRFPKSLSTIPEVELGTGDASYQWFINNVAREFEESAGSEAALFPSRLIKSNTNYPELFDRPFASTEAEGASIIDINPSDGQEIVGIAPLFADSVYGQGTKEGLLVVAKERSFYVVNLSSRSYTKIESEGLGCEAPRSLKSTKNGVTFSNSSGVYRIAKDLSLQYIGKNLEGAWNNSTNKDIITSQAAFQFPIEHKYLLSVGRDDDTENDDVYVYEYTRETEGKLGAWSRYTNFNATRWAGLGNDGYFGTYSGNVLKIRNTGESTDYADDGEAISANIKLAGMHFGKPNERKLVSHVFTSFDSSYDMENTTISISTDHNNTFIDTTPVSISSSDKQVEMFKSSSPERKATMYQVKVVNSTIYEPVTLTGVGYSVSLINSHGVKEAVDSD